MFSLKCTDPDRDQVGKCGRALPFIWSILSFIGILLSIVLVLREGGSSVGDGACKIGAQFNCQAVMASKWSTIFGISLSQYGLFFYTALFLFSLFVGFRIVKLGRFVLVGRILAVLLILFSCYLFIISKFVIGALCPFCIALYLVNLLLAGTVFLFGKGNSVAFKDLGSRRLVFSGAIAIILGALVCYYTVDLAGEILKEDREPAVVDTSGLTLELGGPLGDYYKGSPEATVKVIEFADIECPFCRDFYFQVEDVLSEYGEDVLFVFKNYPLDNSCNPSIPEPFHLNACFGAEFARCAGEQGQFWEGLTLVMSHIAFEQEGLGSSKVRELVTEDGIELLGLNRDALLECLKSGRQVNKIVDDIRQGDKLRLDRTPSVWINGTILRETSPSGLRRRLSELLGKRNDL